MAKKILHLEGLAVFVFCIYLYWINDFSWLLFFLLLFAPDLSIVGYTINNVFGARLYNLFHTYIVSLFVIFLGLLLSNTTFLAVGIICTAHLGIVRLLVFVCKFPPHF